MRRVSLSLSILASLIPALAAAHVGIPSGPAKSGTSSQKITFGISHGCNNNTLDTLAIQIDIPTTGVERASVRPMPSDFGGKPVVTKDSGGVTSVKWMRDADDLQAGDVAYYELTLRMTLGDVPFTRLPFTITQVCRAPGGPSDGSQDVTVVWTGTEEPHPAPHLTVVPAYSSGWNKYTLTTAVAAADFGRYFGGALIVWKGTSAFSANAAINMLITMTAGVTALTTDLAAGDEIWVRY